jgi:CheY-like chemotaxis protein
MPVLTGVEAIRRIREVYAPHVIFVTTRPPIGEHAFRKAELPQQLGDFLQLARELLNQ